MLLTEEQAVVLRAPIKARLRAVGRETRRVFDMCGDIRR